MLLVNVCYGLEDFVPSLFCAMAEMKGTGQVERTRPVVTITQMTAMSYGQGTPQSLEMANMSGLYFLPWNASMMP